MDYNSSFENRAKSFLFAVNTYPHCMEYEFKNAIEELELKDGEILLNLGGGGLNLDKHITKNIKYIPVDFSKEFSRLCNIPHINYNKLPFRDNSVDKIIILALLHHFTNDERTELYRECYRILKPSGKFVVADVFKGSKQDTWLNTFVNKFNPFGHNGNFFTREDALLLSFEGFSIDTKIKKYTWWFNDEKEMFNYVKSLFYLAVSDKQLREALDSSLKSYIGDDNKHHFNWELIYFICSKSNLYQD
jgi:ubiquinone/menaquinone biosynthesis C-methylase UbiE